MKYLVSIFVLILLGTGLYFSFIHDKRKGYELLLEENFIEDILFAQQLLPLLCDNDDVILYQMDIIESNPLNKIEDKYEYLLSVQMETLDLISSLKTFNEEQRELVSEMRNIVLETDNDSLNQLRELFEYTVEEVGIEGVAEYVQDRIDDFIESDDVSSTAKIEMYLGQDIDRFYEDNYNLVFSILVSKISENDKEKELCMYQFKDVLKEKLLEMSVFSKRKKK